jgi:hypothetical protein
MEAITEKALQALAAVIRKRAEEIYEGASEGISADIIDSKDLGRAFSRLLAGESLTQAFGAPGDWGYGTPIGDALAAVYSAGGAGLALGKVAA